MKYLLAIGLTVKPYKCPKLRIFLDDQLIDDIHFSKEINNHSVEVRSNFFFNSTTTEKRKRYPLPKKFFIYEVDDKSLSDGSQLKFEFYDCLSNYNNGFMSDSDEYRLRCVFFAPKKFYFRNQNNFEKEFNDSILKKNNFIHDESEFFPHKENYEFNMPGWPCPFRSELDQVPFTYIHKKGENYTIVYKIIKKYGMYQFDQDFSMVDLDPSPTNNNWNETLNIATMKNDRIWPMNTLFLSFCYHNKDNKYLHEDQ